MQRITKAGFTLIELLVVISIISILAMVALSNFNDSRAVARDVIRVTDMEAIEQALFLFYQVNDRYPGTAEGIPTTGQMIGVGSSIDTALAPYLSEVPRDPRHDGTEFFYAYDPHHNVQISPCPPAAFTGESGVVFGFNRTEVRGVVRQDTCHGGDQQLDQAHYNKALFPVAP